MNNKHTRAVVIKPKMLLFKALGGFLNQEEAQKRAAQVEQELIAFMKANAVSIDIDVNNELHFRPKDGVSQR